MAESGQRSPAAVTSDAAPDLAGLRELVDAVDREHPREAQRTRAPGAVDRAGQGGDREPGIRARPRATDHRAAGRAQSGPLPEPGDRAGLPRDHLRHALARAGAARGLLRSGGDLHAPGGAPELRPARGAREPRLDRRGVRGGGAGQHRPGGRAGREHHRGRRHADLRCARRARRVDLRRGGPAHLAAAALAQRPARGRAPRRVAPAAPRAVPALARSPSPGGRADRGGQHRRRGAAGGRGREPGGDRERDRRARSTACARSSPRSRIAATTPRASP